MVMSTVEPYKSGETTVWGDARTWFVVKHSMILAPLMYFGTPHVLWHPSCTLAPLMYLNRALGTLAHCSDIYLGALQQCKVWDTRSLWVGGGGAGCLHGWAHQSRSIWACLFTLVRAAWLCDYGNLTPTHSAGDIVPAPSPNCRPSRMPTYTSCNKGITTVD